MILFLCKCSIIEKNRGRPQLYKGLLLTLKCQWIQGNFMVFNYCFFIEYKKEQEGHLKIKMLYNILSPNNNIIKYHQNCRKLSSTRSVGKYQVSSNTVFALCNSDVSRISILCSFVGREIHLVAYDYRKHNINNL